jgi:uncharacterized protein (UPF0276 family)
MSITRQLLKEQAPLGVGLGLRGEIFEETLAASKQIDWLEITPENYMGRGGLAQERLTRAQSAYPLVSHGVTLSLGSVDPFDEAYLKQLELLFQQINPPWFSDHLCFSGVDGTYSNDLLPLPRTAEAVNHVVKRIRYIQDRFARPVLIENISYYLDYPGQEMSEAQFLSEILEQSDCGLLLDVNNVYVNAQNHHGDATEFLSALPLERVVQLHVAGHNHYPEGIIDTHGAAVCPEVWALLTWVLQRCKPLGVLLERDLDIPPFAELLDELQQIRAIWDATQRPAHMPELLGGRV